MERDFWLIPHANWENTDMLKETILLKQQAIIGPTASLLTSDWTDQ